MDIVLTHRRYLPVIVAEPERGRIVELTSGHTLIGPGSIPWEVGNAFSAMLKQRRLSRARGPAGAGNLPGYPLRYVEIDMSNSLAIAHEVEDVRLRRVLSGMRGPLRCPIAHLDSGLRRAASRVGVDLVEV